MFENFSDDARRVIVAAQHELANGGQDELTTRHLLLGLFQSTDPQMVAALTASGLTAADIRGSFRTDVRGHTRLPGRNPFSAGAAEVLQRAGRTPGPPVAAADLLGALLTSPDCSAHRLLVTHGIDPDALMSSAAPHLEIPPRLPSRQSH